MNGDLLRIESAHVRAEFVRLQEVNKTLAMALSVAARALIESGDQRTELEVTEDLLKEARMKLLESAHAVC